MQNNSIRNRDLIISKMNFIFQYHTPEGFGDLLMRSDGKVLTGLWFEGSTDGRKHPAEGIVQDLPLFDETRRWLDIYFSGRQPDFTPRYRIDYLTPFRREVQGLMCKIPFGQTATYGDIAAAIAAKHGVAKMSAQAVGGAVGWNPICIIIPCHRVIGADGNLTGYGGGLHNKMALLRLEGLGSGNWRS